MTQLAIIPDEIHRHMLELESMQKMCALLLKTPHYAKLGNDGVFAVVSKAKSLNMDPIYALNGGLYYLQGKVGMPAESMAALIREKGHSITKDSKSNDSICILHGRRADNGDTWTSSFSMEDARRAGLLKNSYEKYPSAMLYNRAMSFLARQLFPDIIKGAGYTLDELKEIAICNPQSAFVEEEKASENLSSEQIEQLKEIISGCAPDFFPKIIEHLKKSPANIENIEDIPANLFERIKLACIKNKSEYQESLKQDIQLEVANT